MTRSHRASTRVQLAADLDQIRSEVREWGATAVDAMQLVVRTAGAFIAGLVLTPRSSPWPPS